jgi:hypothetical protein
MTLLRSILADTRIQAAIAMIAGIVLEHVLSIMSTVGSATPV